MGRRHRNEFLLLSLALLGGVEAHAQYDARATPAQYSPIALAGITEAPRAPVQAGQNDINEHPNATFNGTFNINGTETGDPYADLLLGTPSNYTQSSGQPFYLRNRYMGAYAQDSWQLDSNLTINTGLRWDVIMPWWEKYNQLQTYIAGAQSTLYPGAPTGLVVAGDPGVPRTLAPTTYKNFAPRVGFAYTPTSGRGLSREIFGRTGQSSIRASYGIFYTAFPGLATGIMYSVPLFGFNYLSPSPLYWQRPLSPLRQAWITDSVFHFNSLRTASPPEILITQ